MQKLFSFLICLLFSSVLTAAELSPYQLIWDSPIGDYNGTVPLGNGETAANVWIDETGTLRFFISRIDSIDENGQLLKIGEVKITPFRPSTSSAGELKNYKQVLDTQTGILNADYDMNGNHIRIEFWIDANRNVIVAEINSDKAITAAASNEIWRKERTLRKNLEVSDLYTACNEPAQFRDKFKTPEWDNLETWIEPDTVISPGIIGADITGWYHRNKYSKPYQLAAKIQGTDDFQNRQDPLLHRTFGALIKSSEINPSTKHIFEIAVNTLVPATAVEWIAATKKILEDTDKIPLEKRKAEHIAWWKQFNCRSWIRFSPNTNVSPSTNGEDTDQFLLTQTYALQRYTSACAGRGKYAIKFNGSIFTVPLPGNDAYADYRRWGPGYWWQNTRLPYFSMYAAGDFDMLKPMLDMYLEMLPVQKYRTKKYFGIDGAYYPENVYFWGDCFPETYGWEPWNERKDPLQKNPYHKWEWVGGLELCLFMLDYAEYNGDEKFLTEKALPFCKDILTFFYEYYTRYKKSGFDKDGRIIMYPAQSLETWWDCTNAMPEIAGLHCIVNRLAGLQANRNNDIQACNMKDIIEKLNNALPPIPVMQTPDGKMQLAPAARFDNKRNIENPELYAVFPFRLFAYNKPNLDWALEALKNRKHKMANGWSQDDIDLAYLGLRDEAMDFLLKRAKNKHKESRFPAFWGPNFDWIPDQDHGGILTAGVQALVMQCDSNNISPNTDGYSSTVDLFPALPAGWNVDFKLHAPMQTTVSGKLINGKVVDLKVEPKERKKDVRVLLP